MIYLQRLSSTSFFFSGIKGSSISPYYFCLVFHFLLHIHTVESTNLQPVAFPISLSLSLFTCLIFSVHSKGFLHRYLAYFPTQFLSTLLSAASLLESGDWERFSMPDTMCVCCLEMYIDSLNVCLYFEKYFEIYFLYLSYLIHVWNREIWAKDESLHFTERRKSHYFSS